MSMGADRCMTCNTQRAVCHRESGVGSHFAGKCNEETLAMNRHFVNSRNNLLPCASDKQLAASKRKRKLRHAVLFYGHSDDSVCDVGQNNVIHFASHLTCLNPATILCFAAVQFRI